MKLFTFLGLFVIAVCVDGLAQCVYDQATEPRGGPTIAKDLESARQICTGLRTFSDKSLAGMLPQDITYITVSNQSVLNVTVIARLQRSIASNSALGKQLILDLHRMFKAAVSTDNKLKINLYVVGSEFRIADAETDENCRKQGSYSARYSVTSDSLDDFRFLTRQPDGLGAIPGAVLLLGNVSAET